MYPISYVYEQTREGSNDVDKQQRMSIKSKLRSKFKDTHLGIFFLSIVFGISSWVVFSGIWVEAPLLIQKLPESWKVPSMIGAVSQFAQIGPILLFFLKCKCISCFDSRRRASKFLLKHQVSDRVIIYFLYLVGLVAGAFLALIWDKTWIIAGQPRSVPFFFCVFCLAILDCTCTIVFLTYIGNFRGNYITALYIGEGISSLLPSLFALAQGMGEDVKNCDNSNSTSFLNSTQSVVDLSQAKQPRFGVSAYFWLLFSTLVVSFIAFLFLEFWPTFKKERINHKRKHYRDEYEARYNPITSETLLSNNSRSRESKAKQFDKAVLLVAITVVSFVLYGFLPGLSSYSALPYGSNVMHLASSLALITQPISSFVATFIVVRSTKFLLLLLLLTLVICSYIFTASFMSPCPPWQSYAFGGHIMITVWIVSFSLLMYLRCCITSALKKRHGEQSLIWCGLLTQLGQAIGSILLYILVEFWSIFKEADPCSEINCLKA